MKATIQGGYVEVKGVRTYYERCGHGQPILCLHTAARDCRQYQWLMDELHEEFDVVAFDYPGHGKSWPLPGNRCIEDAEEFVEFIWSVGKTLNLPRPVVAGCSIGGNLTLLVGARHAAEVLAIVPMEAADYAPTISDAALQLMRHPHVSLPYYNMEQSLTLVGSAATEEAKAMVSWTIWHMSPATLAPDLTLYTGLDIRDQMSKVTCPVLMIRGQDDWIVGQDIVDATVSRLVNSSLVEYLKVPGAGHFVPMEAPRVVANAIRRFVASLQR